MPRSSHALAILGSGLYSKLPETRVLLVGAGGIGCELLKNLVLTGFGDITLLDLDTIDLSNLNRQFLFRKKDVKQSKALIAAKTASAFNPAVKITPIHANIKDADYDVDWFSQFDIVLNALDNLDARRHVNKMCLAANVPLVESGTAGYLGQVQPLLKNVTECFDCLPKPTPKTFPVCTIRSTPSQPIHSIVWAKSYLMPQLFGEDEEDGGTELDDAEKQGENADEIASLRAQAAAFKSVRLALRDSTPLEEAARKAFEKVFFHDVKTLLSMADMWKSRKPPLPLNYDEITQVAASSAKENGSSPSVNLRDQKQLSLAECLELFIASSCRLALRLRSGEDTISFDKDDDDALDFVCASSNLRSFSYSIPTKSRWEVKEMAGNIIPAIATTNAIVSGLIVLQALHLLRISYFASKATPPTATLRNVNIQFKPSAPLGASRIVPPNPSCGVCRDTYTTVHCDPSKTLLREVIDGILGDGDGVGTGPREVSTYEDKRVLSDPDFDDNLDRTLESLGVTRGKFLTITDEDGDWATLAISICLLPKDHPVDGPHLILPSPTPIPPRKVKAAPASLKRPADDDDGIEISEGPVTKKARTNGTSPPHLNGNGNGTKTFLTKSPSKKQILEDEGLIIVDKDDDVIIIED
ncbi:hypothetical protein SISNIDRAFT_417318 [Sistotremastrum niveocremeum HHB9708]|uniref:Ubiquitin-activating enzyme E1-like n=1 Tax=Sistotremastrum niveocremeum HHB9708 TaxID=1314777 RepID=A0A164PWA3_9AGAM|nr:hypothetical protein SISNIDRAFT_417318 [Sistotremastrum niveocremeum HHB9708]